MAEKNVILKNTAGDVLYPEVAVKNRVMIIEVNASPTHDMDLNYNINSSTIGTVELFNEVYNYVKAGGRALFKIKLTDTDKELDETIYTTVRIVDNNGENELQGSIFEYEDTVNNLIIVDITVSIENNNVTIYMSGSLCYYLMYDSVASRHIVDKAVTTAKIADKAVTVDKITDKAITTAKIGDDVNNTINGKEDKTPINNVTATAGGTVTLTANSFTNITMPRAGGTVTIAITAPSATNKSVDYDGSITIGTTVPTIKWDSKVKWQSDAPTLNAKKRYEFSIRFDGTNYYALMV